jgi:hypothetical protein
MSKDIKDETKSPTAWLNPAQVEEEFSISRDLLQTFRSGGCGPVWTKVSHKVVRYQRCDVQTWLLNYRPPVSLKRESASPLRALLRDATERLGALETVAKSIALLTPGGAAIPGAQALASDLTRELATLRRMSREGESA